MKREQKKGPRCGANMKKSGKVWVCPECRHREEDDNELRKKNNTETGTGAACTNLSGV